MQEGFLNQSGETHRNKDQLVLVLKSNRIKLQEVLRRFGVPRDKKFRHNVQVAHRRQSHVRHADRRHQRSLQLSAVDVIVGLIWSAKHSWLLGVVFIR